MKRILTLMFALVAVIGVQAQGQINLHLTGCTSVDGNPTKYTDDDNNAEMNFALQPGYTFAGAEVSVKHGNDELSTDYMDETGYYYFSDGYLFFILYDEITEDWDVTITCQEEQAGPDLPDTFTPATFEDLEIAQNDVYRPSSFVVGDNKWLSGAARFNTSVQDWTMWGMGYGYTSTQAVSYEAGVTPASGTDAYLPSAVGAAQGSNYATINIMSAFERINFTKTTLSGVAITNTKVNVDAFVDGDYMSTEKIDGVTYTGLPFHQDDYFLLRIKGLDGETVTGTIEYYLADYRTPGDWKYAKNWQWVELTSLGEIDGLQFELETTKKNNYGATTSSYFCLDNLGGDPMECTLGEMTVVQPVSLAADEAYNVTATTVASEVTYTREMTTDWGTFCLPYAVESNDDVQYYELMTASTDELAFRPVSKLAAGQPAVFRKLAAGSTVEISAQNAILKPANKYDTTSETIASNWTMKGTLTGTSIQGADKYFIAQNKFWIADADTEVKPYRAWFETTTPSNTRNMVISVVDGDATSILTIDGNGNLTEGQMYDLSGRKVNANAKGIVIQNKKLIIK